MTDIDTILQNCINEYSSNLYKYQKMQDYYEGNTDVIKDYTVVKSRNNNKTSVNYIKKFLKEEVSYLVGNKITYISKSSNEDIIKAIHQNIDHWSEKHDQNLCKNLLKFGEVTELYYIGSDGKFNARGLTPLNSYVLADENDIVQLLIHFFKKKFEDASYFDVYYSDRIEHYRNNIKINEDIHYFGEVPCSHVYLSEEKDQDTLFSDLKLLQDSFETNLSDISNEISDFRQAYLKLIGCDITPEQLEELKKLGALKLPNKDSNVEWLIKNINDAFVQNTLTTIEDKIYQISCHINSNEKLQSNSSSLALKTRLISLALKIKDNADAMTDVLKNRLRLLFKIINIKSNILYDYLDIKVKFTELVPADDLMMAQIISQAGDKISTRTAIAQFSFVENVDEEMKRIEAEQSEMIDLDKVDDSNAE